MFPNISRARKWYHSTPDGLVRLKSVVHKTSIEGISRITADEIFGMTEEEWRQYLKDRLEEHELYASLALLASCEGAIRQDMEWRVKNRRPYHLRFRRISSESYVKLSTIINRWRTALGASSHLDCHLRKLSALYVGRNALAHGRARAGDVGFVVVWEHLQKIEQKWRQQVSDFQGF